MSDTPAVTIPADAQPGQTYQLGPRKADGTHDLVGPINLPSPLKRAALLLTGEGPGSAGPLDRCTAEFLLYVEECADEVDGYTREFADRFAKLILEIQAERRAEWGRYSDWVADGQR